MLRNVLALVWRVEPRWQIVRITIMERLKRLAAVGIGELCEPGWVGALSVNIRAIVGRQAEITEHVIEKSVLHESDDDGFDVIEIGHQQPEGSHRTGRCTRKRMGAAGADAR